MLRAVGDVAGGNMVQRLAAVPAMAKRLAPTVLAIFLATVCATLWAQFEDAQRLIDKDPYDRIKLTDKSGGAELVVHAIDVPERRMPDDPAEGDTVRRPQQDNTLNVAARTDQLAVGAGGNRSRINVAGMGYDQRFRG